MPAKPLPVMPDRRVGKGCSLAVPTESVSCPFFYYQSILVKTHQRIQSDQRFKPNPVQSINWRRC